MPYEKEKSKHDEQTLADLSSARRRLQALYQLAQKKTIYFFLVCGTINILLTELSWPLWKNLDRVRENRPNAVVCTQRSDPGQDSPLQTLLLG